MRKPTEFRADKRIEMLSVTVQKEGKVTVFQCQGRIVTGDDAMLLRDLVLSQTDPGTTVLDLARVNSIDAGGLGLLLDLRTRTQSKGIQLTLVNVTRRVQRILELTNLECAFEIRATGEAVSLPYHALQPGFLYV
jgi:anti-anti-sigma factor